MTNTLELERRSYFKDPTIAPESDVTEPAPRDNDDCPVTMTLFANAFQVEVALVAEAEGGFSVFATHLPGCASQGETEDEALAMIADAAKAVIASFIEEGETIPWSEGELFEGEVRRARIVVDV